ncbi:MAG TPA: L-histidine N(alpha)-methyltransferase [Steroidobacteraceae bacterium]|nr:L-histidine N(alpha)-methyltransferase [Steroidobacteraceae bacterium]
MSSAVSFESTCDAPTEDFDELLQGLESKFIPPKYFYDRRGSELFETICTLPEYYPTRTEIAILREHAHDIAKLISPGSVVVELGSGASEKVRLLLDAIEPSAYLGIDISREFLRSATTRLAQDYPWLDVHAACADLSQPLHLTYPPLELPRLVFYPGSSLGNFKPHEAEQFLRQLRPFVGRRQPLAGGLLIGIDLQKDPRILHAAYNDAQGVTAAFNRNLLYRLQRDYGAQVDPEAFAHEAVYNSKEGRIEMYLVSQRDQAIELASHRFEFPQGTRLCTEYSYKYTIDGFADLARRAGYLVEAVWTDAQRLFSVHYLRNSQGQARNSTSK